VGSPGAPQLATKKNRNRASRKREFEISRGRILRASGFRELRGSIFDFRILQDVAAQVLVLYDFGELFVHVGGIDLDVFLFEIGSLEGKFVKNLFQNSVQATGADVFGLLVYDRGELGDGIDRVVGDV